MKTILLVFDGKMSYLPPFQSIVDYLKSTQKYKLVVISTEEDKGIDELYEDEKTSLIHYYQRKPNKNIIQRLYRKIFREIKIRKNITQDINNIPHDILWIIHEKTSVKIANVIKNKKYILSIYELRDEDERLRNKLMPIIKKAEVSVVCEYNRGQIMRTWFKLTESPLVLPNKPFNHPRVRNQPLEIKLPNEKIILYQGILGPDRNLDVLCETIEEMPDYKLLLMGGESQYLRSLLKKYPRTEYIGHIKSPFHLNVTSHAYIGIVTYEYFSLNNIYCAPNKIWEYSGFGIPMLANEIPGLLYTIGHHNAGICTNTNNKECIKKAIQKIDNNYEDYKINASKLYDSCNLPSIIDTILEQYMHNP